MDGDEEREALVNLLGRVGGLIGPCRECGVGMGEVHQYPCSHAPIVQNIPAMECYLLPWRPVVMTREQLEEEYSQNSHKEKP
jgi:hypothetical protein